MIKSLKHIFLAASIAVSFSAAAQTTTSSPYSTYGLGNVRGAFLPQNRALGGISAGLRRPSGYFNINPANPASYSSLQLTTFDIGASGNINNLARGGISETGFTASLSHLVFAIPVSPKSALSFGLLPFTEVGYQFRSSQSIIPPGSDTVNFSNVYKGDGGVSKAYIGYGFQLGNHLSLGFNASYLFGKISRTRSTEFPAEPSALSSRIENSNSVGGVNFDYGVQYSTELSPKTRLTFGYSGSAKSKINSTDNTVITRFRIDELGNETVALDTTFNLEGAKSKITLPTTHTVGFTFERTGKFVVGADYSYAQWSDYRQGNDNPQLQNSQGIAVGAQITPDITAVSNYLKLIDYRLGFRYDKTYIKIDDQNIKQMALTFGFGFPLASNNRSTFYKINLGAELGQRGTLENNLVREKFANIYLGFTLNDKWFQKYKFD